MNQNKHIQMPENLQKHFIYLYCTFVHLHLYSHTQMFISLCTLSEPCQHHEHSL